MKKNGYFYIGLILALIGFLLIFLGFSGIVESALSLTLLKWSMVIIFISLLFLVYFVVNIDLKQFLKPEKGKNTIWLVLFLMTTLYMLVISYTSCPNLISVSGRCTEIDIPILYPCGICIEEIGVADIIVGTIIALIIPSPFLVKLIQPEGDFLALAIPLFFVFHAAYQYLLSCFIVWGYDRIKWKPAKQFLGYDKRKNAITALFFIAVPLFFLLIPNSEIIFILVPLSYFILYSPWLGLNLLLIMLITPLYWYILSCLIFWIYYKVKKK